MKTLYLATASIATLLLAASCSETYDIYPAEYDSVIRIKDGGYHDVNVYSVQDETKYSITVTKGGISPESMANATLRVMTQDEFDAYLLESGAGYSYLPSQCYAFTTGESADQVKLTFDPKEGYQVTEMVLYPPKIGDYLATYTDTSREPVIPIVLESTDSRIDDNSCELFIKPNYSRPIICFTGETNINLTGGANVANLRVGLDGMESPWTINCKIEIDPTVLDAWNAANTETYGVMPADAYTGIGTVKLEEGSAYAPVNVEFDLDKAGFRCALPLRITEVDVYGVEVANSTALVIYEGDMQKFKINVQKGDYLAPDDANDECTNMYGQQGTDGDGPDALFDGDYYNYFHSCYFEGHHYDETYNSYVEIDLRKNVRMVGFEYSNRWYTNATPQEIRIWALDGTEWKEIGHSTEVATIFKCTWGDRDIHKWPVGAFVAPFEFSKVRFSVVKGNTGKVLAGTVPVNYGYWACGELGVFAN